MSTFGDIERTFASVYEYRWAIGAATPGVHRRRPCFCLLAGLAPDYHTAQGRLWSRGGPAAGHHNLAGLVSGLSIVYQCYGGGTVPLRPGRRSARGNGAGGRRDGDGRHGDGRRPDDGRSHTTFVRNRRRLRHELWKRGGGDDCRGNQSPG